MNTKLDQLVYAMLTEDTGRSFLDSGGKNGRHWQRNRCFTLDEFQARPMYEAEIWRYDGMNSDEYDLTSRVDLFQYLTSNLELDDVCESFNALYVANWDSELFLGCSAEQEAALVEEYGLIYSPDVPHDAMPFNTCNFDGSPLSQCVQYYLLRGHDGTDYVLLQIHNGMDVRGGYTNAKLFRVRRYVDAYCLFFEDDEAIREDFEQYAKNDGADDIREVCGGELSEYHGYLYYRDGKVYAKPYDHALEATES